MSVNVEPALRETVLRALLDVAPDIDRDTLDPGAPFREQFDFDSMDHLNFVIGLHKALSIDIPEVDYPQLATLNGCIAYLTRNENTRAVSTHPR
jgi:acyl carrier protein